MGSGTQTPSRPVPRPGPSDGPTVSDPYAGCWPDSFPSTRLLAAADAPHRTGAVRRPEARIARWLSVAFRLRSVPIARVEGPVTAPAADRRRGLARPVRLGPPVTLRISWPGLGPKTDP